LLPVSNQYVKSISCLLECKPRVQTTTRAQ
jgi:hypothetical protein